MIKVHYFPFIELSLFVLAVVVLTIATVFNFNLWLILFLLLVAYLGTLGSAYIIMLKNDELIFSSLNPFMDSHSIKIESIVKLNSEQSYEFETDVTAEATFPLFRRKYQLEYIDKNNTKKLFFFSIQSKGNMQKIFEVINNISK